MTVHGDQYLLPLFVRRDSQKYEIRDNEELSLAFYLLIKNRDKNEKIISFSRLLWPILSIQGQNSTHIMIDGLNILKNEGKFTNPPRQPLIGHILRNVENKTKIEQLNTIIDILSYKDKEAKEIGEGEDSQYQNLIIDGLIYPEFLQTLNKIIPLIEYRAISDYTVLDSKITTENALDIAEKYRQIINSMRGNALRWNTQIELIEKEVNKWLNDLNVELKDLDTLYSSQINKTSSSIDSNQIDEQIKWERDKIDQWNVNEKKKITDSMSTLFRTAERQLEEMIKKNKFFTSIDSIKSRVFEDILPKFEGQLLFLKKEANRFLNSLESFSLKFNELKNRASIINEESKKKIKDFQDSLDMKLKDRDKRLTEFESEKKDKIEQLDSIKTQIEDLFNQIKKLIQLKNKACLNDAENLQNWALNDNQIELFSKAVQWIYMPFYAMFIEDEDNMEEYMNVVFPGYINNDPNNIYEDLSESFIQLKKTINEKIESDMAIRSNFEFSCERINLINDPTLKKKLQMGISKLREKNLINDVIEQKIREFLT